MKGAQRDPIPYPKMTALPNNPKIKSVIYKSFLTY
jgi:hypothetical protein